MSSHAERGAWRFKAKDVQAAGYRSTCGRSGSVTPLPANCSVCTSLAKWTFRRAEGQWRPLDGEKLGISGVGDGI